jgi:hypothetical protein
MHQHSGSVSPSGLSRRIIAPIVLATPHNNAGDYFFPAAACTSNNYDGKADLLLQRQQQRTFSFLQSRSGAHSYISSIGDCDQIMSQHSQQEEPTEDDLFDDNNIPLLLLASTNESASATGMMMMQHQRRNTTTKDKTTTGYQALARMARIQWSLLSPLSRRMCMILSPILLFFTAVFLLDCTFARYRYPPTNVLVGSSSSNAKYFAVVINTYRRPQQLSEAVRHYAETCGRRVGVDTVYVVWAEEGVQPPSPTSFFNAASSKFGGTNQHQNALKNRSTVQILQVRNSLNSRFLPIPGMNTEAVFMVDDDIRVNCRSLTHGFKGWKANPQAMVGYYPRLAVYPRDPGGEYVYQAWPIVFLRGQMNIILTKACFLHTRYMDIYSSDQHPQEIKDYIDKYFNCEDIAMSLLVANITKHETPPTVPVVYVEGQVSDLGLFNGISRSADDKYGVAHHSRRSECLTELTAIYVKHQWDAPLDKSFNVQQSSWYRHCPGFWWQSRPSNFFEWIAPANLFK